jgi:hypothetical protein
MKVYHGSHIKIDRIDLSKCKPRKDFGRGFYVTNIRSQAEVWAERIGEFNNCDGVITTFDFDEFAFEDADLSVLRFDKYSEEWLDFILLNRNNRTLQQVHVYDIVEGPVADDAVSIRIYDYLGGNISKQDFLEELKFKKQTHQLCFCTTASLQMLSFVEKTNDSKILQIDDLIVEQLMLDNQIDETQAVDLYYKSETFKKLSDEATEFYKKTWQEIYELLKKEK